MNKKTNDKLSNFDEAFEDGCFVEPISPDVPRYRYKDLFEYAKNQNKDTSELTDEELKMFLIL